MLQNLYVIILFGVHHSVTFRYKKRLQEIEAFMNSSGEDRARTDDLLTASQAL